MIRITISHVNKQGQIQFPVKKAQLFVSDENVPQEKREPFYKKLVDEWLSRHPDRSLFEWEKDIVNPELANGSKVYGASAAALGKEGEPTEEPI